MYWSVIPKLLLSRMRLEVSRARVIAHEDGLFLYVSWMLRTAADGAPVAWNSRVAQTHRQPPNLSHKLCLVHGKDHVALQRSRGGENEEFGGNWVGIGRIRFTFLSRDVISRQGQTKANTQVSEEREEESNLCSLLKMTFYIECKTIFLRELCIPFTRCNLPWIKLIAYIFLDHLLLSNLPCIPCFLKYVP